MIRQCDIKKKFRTRYRNGIWQFNNSGKDIHRELNERFGQIENIHIERLYKHELFFFIK